MRIKPLIQLVLPVLTACSVGPNFKPPETAAPPRWLDGHPTATVASEPVEEPIEARWWQSFNDPLLTRLVVRAAHENLDVKAAVARLAQSRAQLRVTGADQYPTINGDASYDRERISPNGVVGLLGGGSSASPPSRSIGSSPVPPFNLWQSGFDASWELDLWGRVRRSVENAEANLGAKAEARHDTLLSTVAEVAKDYLQLRGTQETLRITRNNLQSQQRSVTLTAERARRGFVTDLDEQQAVAQAENTAAQIPQLEQQQDQLVNALGLLLGEYPRALRAELLTPLAIPLVQPHVPIGLPSELVERRPDIREASAQLHAATAAIGVAEANFFPKVTLSGNLDIQATDFLGVGNLVNNTYSFGPSISLPIFQGGSLRGTLALRRAQLEETAANYHQTVLSAFRDVNDGLTAYEAEQRRQRRLDAAVIASQRALDLADQRYREGFTDYLPVLTAEQTLLSSEKDRANSRQTVATNLVSLFKALGGGWETPELTVANAQQPGGT
jgi:NodT family efflux transporter outer membrane factor (OMF) lipoprotein